MTTIASNAAFPCAAPRTISLVLNGRPVTTADDPTRTLLDIVRDDFGLISPKNGCQPQAQCGCCTVLVDGKPRLSCVMKPAQVAGKSVVTAEGLSPELRDRVAECFVRAGGVQCGFCIPGMAMRGVGLLKENPNPTRDEIAHDLRAHLCRCTGYAKIVDAIQMLAAAQRGEAIPPPDLTGHVGGSLDRWRGRELVLGDFKYVDDITIPGSAFAAMRFSDHPRALVKAIDTSAALAHPGVARVLTAADVPGDRYVGLITKDWPVLVAIGEETRYVGDVLAVVVADDQRTAREAAKLVKIDYEVRPPITTPEDGLKPDAPKIHPKGNVLSRSHIHRGDADAALAASAFVVEDTFQTQFIEHMFLEPEACIAIPFGAVPMWDRRPAGLSENAASRPPMTGETPVPHWVDETPVPHWVDETPVPHWVDETPVPHWVGETPVPRDLPYDSSLRLKILTQGQGVFDDRRQIASILGWDLSRIDAELIQNGGAFGGKEDMSIQGQTALAATLCGRPVKCTLTRDESFRIHPKRHPIKIQMKVGCDAEGHLTAVWARMIGDKGAYASVGAKVLERAAGHATGPYKVPAVDIESVAVYTNNPPCGAMRGFGANQSAFAVEGLLDRLAKKVGIDGWEMRWRNALDVGDRFCTGQKLDKPFGLKRSLLAVKDAYRSAKYAGIACGIKNVGIGNGMPDVGKAVLTVEAADRIVIRTGFTEMGQGYFTLCLQTACQETGLPPGVFVPMTDTSVNVDCGQTTASRATVLGGLSIMQAARKLKADLDAGRSLGDLVGRHYVGEYACTYTTKLGADVAEPKTHLTYGFATQVAILDDAGKLVKFIAAHDVGRVMNRTLLEGQIEGSIHMGLGYALTENFEVREGRIEAKNIKALGVLRAHQMPEMEVILIEEPDPECPYGARGVGEIGLVPTAPAVAGALAAFDGIHRTTLPMKDSPAARAIMGG